MNIFNNDSINQLLAVHDEMIGTDISRVLIIYTGGTIGMKNTDKGYQPFPEYLSQTLASMVRFNDPTGFENSQTIYETTLGQQSDMIYRPLSDDAKHDESLETFIVTGVECIRMRLRALITPPSIYKKRTRYSILEYDRLLDSSNMNIEDWVRIATDIQVNYKLFDAFIILHGTDTMAYTASVLSFMLENLGKTVIITGSQIPLAEVRNDAVENILGALEIAAHFVIPEVGLFFDNQLFRGNRTSKVNAIELDAFESPNLNPLVKLGIKIEVSWPNIWRPTDIAPFSVHKAIDSSVTTLRLFPGISESTLGAFLSVPEITGVVLETFGSGNAPNNRPGLLNILKKASDRGIVIVNISQCKRGLVTDLYATGRALSEIGIVPGSDMTSECALAKLAYLLGKYPNQPAKVRHLMRTNLRGELTILEVKQQFTYFVSHGLASSIKILLRKNDSLEVEGESQSAALEKSLVPMVLCIAARTGDVNAIQSTAMHYPHLINAVDYDKRTPLHVACSEGQITAVKCLLKLGASIHARDRFECTPLRNAIKFGHLSTAKILLAAGAHISDLEAVEVINEVMTCIALGDLSRITMYVEAGTDINLAWIDSRTPLHMAAAENQLEIVTYFIDLAIKWYSSQNHSPIRTGSEILSGSIMRCINPINLEPQDKYGKTPIDYALQNGDAGKAVYDILVDGITRIPIGEGLSQFMRIQIYSDQLSELKSLLHAAKDRKYNILIKGEKGIGKSLKSFYSRNVDDVSVDFEILRIESILLRKHIPAVKSGSIILLENLQYLTPAFNDDPITAKAIKEWIKALDIFIIGTTTVDLPHDIMDCFSFTIDLPLPSASQRSELIQDLLTERELKVISQDLQDLIDKSAGLSTGQIMESFTMLEENFPQESPQTNQNLEDKIKNLKVALQMYYRPLSKNLVKLPEISIPQINEDVVKRLEKLLFGFSKSFNDFRKLGVEVPGGILLHGPVGVGKTRLALSLLQKYDLNVLTVKPSQVFSKYLSESEENIVKLFRRAVECSPCVIFFDEIDVYGCRRDIENKGSNVNARILSTLLNEMDGIGLKRNILVLGTCSDLKRCDDALLRPGRLDVLIRIDEIENK